MQECAGFRSVDRPRKRWIDTVKECLNKRFDYQASKENSPGWEKMVGVCEGEYMGRSPGEESLTLTRCHSCGLPQLYEALEG